MRTDKVHPLVYVVVLALALACAGCVPNSHSKATQGENGTIRANCKDVCAHLSCVTCCEEKVGSTSCVICVGEDSRNSASCAWGR